jgi:hypothetical protein
MRSVAAAVLLAVFWNGGAPAQTASSARSTADRTDDFPGYQIHVMYVLPSDGTDANLDTNGAIASSVAAAQKWFVAQTRGTRRLRFDTSNGQLDISFLRLARTDAEIAGSGAYVRDQIQSEINTAGFNHPEKIYAVYYGGSSTYADARRQRRGALSTRPAARRTTVCRQYARDLRGSSRLLGVFADP